eukprot:Rmarinus@m.12948
MSNNGIEKQRLLTSATNPYEDSSPPSSPVPPPQNRAHIEPQPHPQPTLASLPPPSLSHHVVGHPSYPIPSQPAAMPPHPHQPHASAYPASMGMPHPGFAYPGPMIQQVYAPPPQHPQHPQHPQRRPGAGPMTREVPVIPEGQWVSGLLDCFSACTTAAMSFFCCCFRWSQTMHRARVLQYTRALLVWVAVFVTCFVLFQVLVGLGMPGDPFFMFLVMTSGFAFLAGYYRNKLRTKYGIEGSPLSDFFSYCLCPCCSYAQEAQHVDLAEVGYNPGCIFSAEPPKMQVVNINVV